ncbi:swr complex subunit [Pichia californica]|uniref:SWR1-complex protein 5 n=1 Tax=Pichia californica TaxID=460514 RepID=A0A9P6WLJ3_9ASCO|nr:swr complex subunit [[Candida] californica]KAG0689331.1 swr complex subunit [[Candida] californica]
MITLHSDSFVSTISSNKENTPQTSKSNQKEPSSQILPQKLENEASQDSQDSDDYIEDQDEDYVIKNNNISNNLQSNNNASENDDDDDEEFFDDEDKKEMAKYSSIESSEGGLIKTRRQRLQEDENLKKEKKLLALINSNNGKSKTSKVDINSIWAELNNTGNDTNNNNKQTLQNSAQLKSEPQVELEVKLQPESQPQTSNSSMISSDNKIKITRTYEFAGSITNEVKWVDANSEEAKAYLNSVTIKPSNTNTNTDTDNNINNLTPSSTPSVQQKNLRRKRKRASLLDAVISNSSKTKLSTLEKSRLDWATYVDKNKISNELKYTNKDGYLEKQDFLNRVDSRRDNLYTDAKSKISKQN